MAIVKLAQATIVERKDFTEEHWIIKLQPDIPYNFKAGQYCTIGSRGIERPYSIVSAPDEALLELFIELIPPPEGVLTPVLFDLQPGSTVTLRPRPKGLFLLDEKYKNHVMVSTVTGVCPYVSMLRQYVGQGRDDGHRFFLLDGGSYYDELVYRTEMDDLAERYDFIHYVPTVSRPQETRNTGWHGETGRVNSIVEKYLDQFGLQAQDTVVYACGNPGMIDDVRGRAALRGIEFKEERFWKEDD